jgi:hypothetical protein
MITLTVIADKITDSLNAAPEGIFSVDFSATRKRMPSATVKEMNTIHVTVVPRSSEKTPITRKHVKFDYRVDVGIQKRLPGNETEEDDSADSLETLAFEIAQYLHNIELVGLETVKVLASHVPLSALPEHLKEMRQFTEVVEISAIAYQEKTDSTTADNYLLLENGAPVEGE